MLGRLNPLEAPQGEDPEISKQRCYADGKEITNYLKTFKLDVDGKTLDAWLLKHRIAAQTHQYLKFFGLEFDRADVPNADEDGDEQIILNPLTKVGRLHWPTIMTLSEFTKDDMQGYFPLNYL